MPRLFTGLELPPALSDQLADFATPLAGARWIEPRAEDHARRAKAEEGH